MPAPTNTFSKQNNQNIPANEDPVPQPAINNMDTNNALRRPNLSEIYPKKRVPINHPKKTIDIATFL